MEILHPSTWVEVEQEAHLEAVGLPMAAWGFNVTISSKFGEYLNF